MAGLAYSSSSPHSFCRIYLRHVHSLHSLQGRYQHLHSNCSSAPHRVRISLPGYPYCHSFPHVAEKRCQSRSSIGQSVVVSNIHCFAPYCDGSPPRYCGFGDKEDSMWSVYNMAVNSWDGLLHMREAEFPLRLLPHEASHICQLRGLSLSLWIAIQPG